MHNRKREPTPADGNCQFIAVARGVGLPDDSHRQLREDVVDYLRKNRAEFEGFADSSWDAYIAYMSTVDVGWGEHVTLTILSRICKCEIQLVRDLPGEFFSNLITPVEIEKDRITIAHYDECITKAQFRCERAFVFKLSNFLIVTFVCMNIHSDDSYCM